ncbi:hypothetical protein MJO28_002877, partial [Puccinia striiformis f. sp. tritici]
PINSNNSLSTRITAIRKNNINQTGEHSIHQSKAPLVSSTNYAPHLPIRNHCGATPARLGNWCQSCVNVSASIPSTLPAVAIQRPTKKSTLPAVAIQPPTNNTKSAHEILCLKRQEAIQQALSFQSNTIPNPVTQSQLAQNLVIANSQAVMAQFSASGSQELNSLKVISVIPSKPHLSVGPYESGRPNEDRAKFVTEHFPYCRLGLQKSGLVEDYESFVDFLKQEKEIDLIFDGDAFLRDQLDLEELHGMKDTAKKYNYNGFDSSLPSGDFITFSKVKNTTKTEKHPVDKHNDSRVMIKNSTSKSTLRPTRFIDDEIKVVVSLYNNTSSYSPTEIGSIGISNPILNPQDLSWDRFETPENSLSLHNDKDLNWVDGVRYELKLDGLNPTQRICLYQNLEPAPDLMTNSSLGKMMICYQAEGINQIILSTIQLSN